MDPARPQSLGLTEECGGMCYSLVMRLSQVFSPGKHLITNAVEKELSYLK